MYRTLQDHAFFFFRDVLQWMVSSFRFLILQYCIGSIFFRQIWKIHKNRIKMHLCVANG